MSNSQELQKVVEKTKVEMKGLVAKRDQAALLDDQEADALLAGTPIKPRTGPTVAAYEKALMKAATRLETEQAEHAKALQAEKVTALKAEQATLSKDVPAIQEKFVSLLTDLTAVIQKGSNNDARSRAIARELSEAKQPVGEISIANLPKIAYDLNIKAIARREWIAELRPW